MLNVIIFSKDRACQLELLLRSMKLFLKHWNSCHISVIYAHSNIEYEQAYSLIKKEYGQFNYLCENNTDNSFHSIVLDCINLAQPYTMFLVDDIVFRATVDLTNTTFREFTNDPEILCLSLRLSPQITYCYSTNTPSPPPTFSEKLVWNWTDSPSNTD
jgi:hypothetical protein